MAVCCSARAVARINLDAIAANYHQVRHLVGDRRQIWPAVKANAYGHGAIQVVSRLMREGADGFCVATPEEAMEIRDAAGNRRILILGALEGRDINLVFESASEVIVTDLSFARELSAKSVLRRKKTAVHLKLDTGMGRLGFQQKEAIDAVEQILTMEGLQLAGVMTHFPSADELDHAYTRKQTQTFLTVSQKIVRMPDQKPLLHCANSGAILAHPDAWVDAVRPGIMIYGSYPSRHLSASTKLLPAMTLAARIVLVKEIEAGTTVSYGRTWTATRASKIATVSIGYGDGLPRMLSNNGEALVNGQLAPIAGRVCMDLTMLDVTDIKDVSVGDEAVFWGDPETLAPGADEIADRLGTISYELFCGVSARVPRTYL